MCAEQTGWAHGFYSSVRSSSAERATATADRGVQDSLPASPSGRAQDRRAGKSRSAPHPLHWPAETAVAATVDRCGYQPETSLHPGSGTKGRPIQASGSPGATIGGLDGYVRGTEQEKKGSRARMASPFRSQSTGHGVWDSVHAALTMRAVL